MNIVEVGPRDGIQNEQRLIPTELKIQYIDALVAAGIQDIEITAFVSPKWVPQLADAEKVCRGIQRRAGVRYSALVPNLRGYERAVEVDLNRIALFTAASESFTQNNINTTIDGSFLRFQSVASRAHADGMPMRGYVSTAFWCPYAGQVGPQAVLSVAQRLLDLGVKDVSIGDTIGKADTEQVRRVLDVVLKDYDPKFFSMHFHDTYGRGVENIRVAAEYGITRFDSSTGGIGGCPYAPGAAGNVATESVVRALKALGYSIDIDPDGLVRAAQIIRGYLHTIGPIVEGD